MTRAVRLHASSNAGAGLRRTIRDRRPRTHRGSRRRRRNARPTTLRSHPLSASWKRRSWRGLTTAAIARYGAPSNFRPAGCMGIPEAPVSGDGPSLSLPMTRATVRPARRSSPLATGQVDEYGARRDCTRRRATSDTGAAACGYDRLPDTHVGGFSSAPQPGRVGQLLYPGPRSDPGVRCARRVIHML